MGDDEAKKREIGKRIKEMIEAANPDITKASIQRELGYKSWDTIHKWCQGKSTPPPQKLSKLAKILGTTIEYIVDGVSHDGPFENYHEIMKLPIVERGWAIMREAAKSQGITQYMSAEGGSDKPETLKKYLNGEETEEELYNRAVERFKEVAEKIEKLMKDGL